MRLNVDLHTNTEVNGSYNLGGKLSHTEQEGPLGVKMRMVVDRSKPLKVKRNDFYQVKVSFSPVV